MKKIIFCSIFLVILSFVLTFNSNANLKIEIESGNFVIPNFNSLEPIDIYPQIPFLIEPMDSEIARHVVKMTILYDNYVHLSGTVAKWGFSCLIETGDNTILFDTGGDGDVLLHNIRELKVDLSEVDIIVISHNHWDHTGGLVSVLESNKSAKVYLPESFPQEFISNIKEYGNEVILVNESIELCSNVNSTGNLSGPINEQSLIVQTNKGPVLITGCSHPGIVSIVEKAEELSGENVYLVFGGFHLMRLPDNSVDKIIEDFHKLGVEKCGATHCTGDTQIKRFKDAYKDDFIEIGTGKMLEF